jgi:tetratricopeptide (TPR) repeat protein
VVANYPNASWAAEAQFRSGWLEINRGHFREALPGCARPWQRYPKSAFADDAAWYLAFAHYLLGDSTEALKAITTYAEVAKRGNEDAAMRARYWRARILVQAGRKDEAKPLSARLREPRALSLLRLAGAGAPARDGRIAALAAAPGRAAEPAPCTIPWWRAPSSSIA